MHLEWLADFILLAQTGSFSKAAEQRALTHSAFGRRIKLLENWAGTPLVERSQPVRLTAAGKTLLHAAENVTQTLTQVRSQFHAAPAAPPLRISTGHILASHFFPPWYQQIQRKIGFTPMTVITAGAEFSIQRFVAAEADLLIAYQTPMTDMLLPEKSFIHKIVGQETIIPVTADRQHTRLDTLLTHNARIPWLGYDKSLSLRGLLMHFLQHKQILPHLHPVFSADNYETLKEMALKGVGIVWLPACVVADDVQKRRLFVMAGEKLQIRVPIALYRRRDSQDAALLSVWSALNE